MTPTLSQGQAEPTELLERVKLTTWTERENYGDDFVEAFNAGVRACIDALAAAQLAAVAAPPEVMCHHEAYQGRCIHCDLRIVNGRAITDLSAAVAAPDAREAGGETLPGVFTNVDDLMDAMGVHPAAPGSTQPAAPQLDTQRATEGMPAPVEPIPLNIIRWWPDGFAARMEHVWRDLVGLIPNYKLHDLQRMLAEYGFTMVVYEGPAPTALPVVHPTGERTASSEGPREAHAGYGALPDDKDGASPPVQQGVVEALESARPLLAGLKHREDDAEAARSLALVNAALASLRPPAAMEKP